MPFDSDNYTQFPDRKDVIDELQDVVSNASDTARCWFPPESKIPNINNSKVKDALEQQLDKNKFFMQDEL